MNTLKELVNEFEIFKMTPVGNQNNEMNFRANRNFGSDYNTFGSDEDTFGSERDTFGSDDENGEFGSEREHDPETCPCPCHNEENSELDDDNDLENSEMDDDNIDELEDEDDPDQFRPLN